MDAGQLRRSLNIVHFGVGIDRRQALGQLVGLLFAVEVSKPLVRAIFPAGIHPIELRFNAKGCGRSDVLIVAFAFHDVALDLHLADPVSGQREAKCLFAGFVQRLNVDCPGRLGASVQVAQRACDLGIRPGHDAVVGQPIHQAAGQVVDVGWLHGQLLFLLLGLVLLLHLHLLEGQHVIMDFLGVG